MTDRPAKLGVLLLMGLLVVACGGSEMPANQDPIANSAMPADGAADQPAEDAPGSAETTPEPAPAAAEPDVPANPLLDPDSPEMNRRAPEQFRARFRTSQGDFVVEVHRDWSPIGADRFYNLVRAGFFDDTRVFRMINGFIAQFGLSGDPDVNAAWSWAELQDEPVRESNTTGRITYAMGGPNTRTTQVFINLRANTNLDSMGFAPFGEVVEGLDVVQRLYGGYGEAVDQGQIMDRGNAYLDGELPQLDSISRAAIQ